MKKLLKSLQRSKTFHSLYAEIVDFDLIAKEFKYHQVCYQKNKVK